MKWTAKVKRAAMRRVAAFDRRYGSTLLDLAFGAGVLAILPVMPLARDDSYALIRCSVVDGFDRAAGVARAVRQSLDRY